MTRCKLLKENGNNMETVSTLCTSILKKVKYKYESSQVKLKIVIETHIGKNASPALNSKA
jgi:hypothetical protein